jgi:hypothetical protein
VTEEDPSQEATPAAKKRKLGTAVGELGVSDSFAVELMGTCAAPGGRMSSPELRESSARMLEVTGGRWPKNVLIPCAASEDLFLSRMARDLKVFPYGRNIAAVVSAVMNKDRQDAAQKRQVVIRITDPRREAKRARGSAKAAASGSSQPMPAAKPAAPGSSKALASAKTIASGGIKPPPGGSAKGRELPSPGRRIGDFCTDISVEDYLVGKFFLTSCLTGDLSQGRVKSSWLLSRLRWQPCCQRRWLGEGCHARSMSRFLRERRDSVGRCRQGSGGLHVPAAEGGVAAVDASKLCWTSTFVVCMRFWGSCAFVRRPTSPTAWRRVS